MYEQRPTLSPDDPWNRHPPAVRPELIPALPRPHPVLRPSPVELRPAFAQTEQRRVAGTEAQPARRPIDRQRLNLVPRRIRDPKRQRLQRELNPHPPMPDGLCFQPVPEDAERLRPWAVNQRAVIRHGRWVQRDPQSMFADRYEVDFEFRSGV